MNQDSANPDGPQTDQHVGSATRCVAWLVVCLGVVGIVLSLVLIWPVFSLRHRLVAAIGTTTDRVDDLLMNLHQRVDSTSDGITRARGAGQDLNREVQRRVAESRGLDVDEAADLEELERLCRAVIQRVGERMSLLQSVSEFCQQLVDNLNSLAIFTRRDRDADISIIETIGAGRDALEETTDLFDEVTGHLNAIREEAALDEHADQVTSLIARIDTTLGRAESATRQLAVGLDDLRSQVIGLTKRIVRQLNWSAAVVTILLVWMAISQLSLVVHGWQWRNHSRSA